MVRTVIFAFQTMFPTSGNMEVVRNITLFKKQCTYFAEKAVRQNKVKKVFKNQYASKTYQNTEYFERDESNRFATRKQTWQVMRGTGGVKEVD